MDSERMTDEEIQKFLNACEDLMRLGAAFTGNVRTGFSDFKRTAGPVLKSNYVDKGAAELLTQSLNEFERKMDSNLEALNKICMKGGKWFVFFLGKSLGKNSQSLHSQDQSSMLEEIQSDSPSDAQGKDIQQAKKMGA
jgi:hypothetical protein